MKISDFVYSVKVLRWFIDQLGLSYKDFFSDVFKTMMGSIEPLRKAAQRRGNKPAVLWDGGMRTHLELFQRAEALAKFLLSEGVKPGEKLAFISINTPEAPEIWLCSVMLRLSLIPVNWHLKSEEIKYIMQNSGCKNVIYHTDVKDEVKKSGEYKVMLEIDGTESSSYEQAINLGMLLKRDVKVSPRARSGILIYTSGTTGKPKGAPRKLNPLYAFLFVATAAYEFGITKDDVHLAVAPLYHSAPFFFAQLHISLGGTLVILPRFRVENFFEAVAKFKPTTTFVVPYMIYEIMDNLDSFGKEKLSSLKKVISGAAYLNPETKMKFVNTFGPILYEFYGSTETGINTILRPSDIPKKAESVGKPMPLNKIKILDDSGKECPPDTPGEIFIKSPFIIRGYYKDPTYTKQWTKEGYFSAGDVGKIDKDGYLYILDRKKDMIISAGVNIYPAEIEQVLMQHPAVKMCAVVGVKDEKWGEKVKAFIVLRKGYEVSEKELEKFLRERIANYKVPKEWAFLDELPMTPSGKVLKRVLREMK